MPKERSDILRRRPKILRYFFLAVSNDDSLHVGTSYGGLAITVKKYGVKDLYLADVVTGKVDRIKEPVEVFMERWSREYNNVEWDYFLDSATTAPPRKTLRKGDKK